MDDNTNWSFLRYKLKISIAYISRILQVHMTQDSFVRLSNVTGIEVLHIPTACGENAKNEPFVKEIRCFGTHVTLFVTCSTSMSFGDYISVHH